MYKIVTMAYLATLFYVFVRFPNYTGIVFTSMMFWLSVRGIFRQELLVGASFPYIPVQGNGVRLLSILICCVALVLFYIQVTASELGLQLWAVLLIFALLPGVMWAGTELKRRMKSEARPVEALNRE
jgi:hypothetical protein